MIDLLEWMLTAFALAVWWCVEQVVLGLYFAIHPDEDCDRHFGF